MFITLQQSHLALFLHPKFISNYLSSSGKCRQSVPSFSDNDPREVPTQRHSEIISTQATRWLRSVGKRGTIFIIFSQVSKWKKTFPLRLIPFHFQCPSHFVLSIGAFHLQEVSISLIYMWKNVEHHVVRVWADTEFHSILISSLTVTIESIMFSLPSLWPPQRSQIAFHLMCQSPSDHVHFSLLTRHHMTC